MIDRLTESLEGGEEGSEALDEQIAEHGLGWEKIDAYSETEGYLWKCPDGSRSGLPPWSSNLGTALKLIKDVDWDISYTRFQYNQYGARVDDIYARAPTAALALCVAWARWLKAPKAVG